MSSEEAKPKEARRRQVRYAVSDDCRIRSSILLRSSDEGSANTEWRGTLVDVSAEGAHVQISLSAVAYRGDSCIVKLEHGAVRADIRGSLAHYVCSSRHSVCGVRFDFSFKDSDRHYQPFFKAITASAGLAAGPAGPGPTGRYKEEYSGPGSVKLVVWRDEAGGPLVAFDYTMSRYGAVLGTVGADMPKNKEQVRFKLAPAEGGDASAPLLKAQEAEARWEFSIAASNLPKAVAADVRRLLRLIS